MREQKTAFCGVSYFETQNEFKSLDINSDGYTNKILNTITNKKLYGYLQQEYSKRKCKIQEFSST